MTRFTPNASHFTALTGAYYPTGHVFAMFADESAAQAASNRMQAVPDVGDVTLAMPDAIQAAFAKRAAEVGAMPSVGREDQFMLRFVELARAGKCGLLIDMGNADAEAVQAVLDEHGALVAYHYRNLVIEEMVTPTPKAEAAAAGRL
ncbi:hypothetical protein [Ottowia sp.]|uniref:hypothetical protein n=1 Tax=Ottowia sp. TaxID=1898956 RepID=UPI002BC93E78|nr:hypothetical protein [Ottowia sp.]HOB65899.1 hypothetical protein [Ottowia sp.]HPZ56882.1 hypothetical protein [Ottowia sp.]HQD47758.1 hypothetical protein [Ottowia sp.]